MESQNCSNGVCISMIAPASFDLSNQTSSYDIFAYFREVYNTKNLHESEIVSIYASTTFPPGDSNRTNASILISEPDGGRWVSEIKPNQFITIDFHQNSVDLIGYFFLTNIGARFINSWDVYGVYNNKMYLLDRRVNTPLCSPSSSSCQVFNNLTFRSNRSGNFHKFRIVHTSTDSNDENIFSLSNIRFYGAVNSYFLFQTCGIQSYVSLMRSFKFFIIFFTS